jgi:MoxR-like ATPase
VREVKEWANTIRKSIEQVIYSKGEIIEMLLVTLLCQGHALLEDVPGVGKTILARALAMSFGGQFKRIQCTPDLLPTDVLGVSVYNPKTGEFNYRPGPVITNFLLVDEINRATPRTQSALLEAMAEYQISIDGKTLPLLKPFFLMATENPVEFEGTFILPESQKDRFFLSLKMGYPGQGAEEEILQTHSRLEHPINKVRPVVGLETIFQMQKHVIDVYVHPNVRKYILSIINESRSDSKIQLGISPRGSLALYRGGQALAALRGRDYVIPEDIKELAIPVLAKRIMVKTEQSVRGYTEYRAIQDIIDRIDVPVIKRKA